VNPEQLIAESLAKLGDSVAILAHHYQHDDVIRHAHIVGDSLELARRQADLAATSIVFCGVSFMAESAAILAAPGQAVYAPAPEADCVMARQAPALLVERVLAKLNRERRVIPLAYVNTSAAVKAACGRYGGSVCTSANAPLMLRWALERGDSVLFLPDRNLAVNTARQLRLHPDEMHMLDIRAGGERIDMPTANQARLLIWPGCCAIHQRFQPGHVEAARRMWPGARVLAHPECPPLVVQACDGAGSTSYLIKETRNAPDGSTLVIGTEINLVKRLARPHAGRVAVHPLEPSACSNMGKTTEERLALLLDQLVQGTATPQTVPESLATPARLALRRMLDACATPTCDNPGQTK